MAVCADIYGKVRKPAYGSAGSFIDCFYSGSSYIRGGECAKPFQPWENLRKDIHVADQEGRERPEYLEKETTNDTACGETGWNETAI